MALKHVFEGCRLVFWHKSHMSRMKDRVVDRGGSIAAALDKDTTHVVSGANTSLVTAAAHLAKAAHVRHVAVVMSCLRAERGNPATNAASELWGRQIAPSAMHTGHHMYLLQPKPQTPSNTQALPVTRHRLNACSCADGRPLCTAHVDH